jgi:hypothetical protein
VVHNTPFGRSARVEDGLAAGGGDIELGGEDDALGALAGVAGASAWAPRPCEADGDGEPVAAGSMAVGLAGAESDDAGSGASAAEAGAAVRGLHRRDVVVGAGVGVGADVGERALELVVFDGADAEDAGSGRSFVERIARSAAERVARPAVRRTTTTSAERRASRLRSPGTVVSALPRPGSGEGSVIEARGSRGAFGSVSSRTMIPSSIPGLLATKDFGGKRAATCPLAAVDPSDWSAPSSISSRARRSRPVRAGSTAASRCDARAPAAAASGSGVESNERA